MDLDARRNGLAHLDPAKNPLIGLGMETDGDGRVTKNSYGVFNLSWQVPEHPEWPGAITAELDEIRNRIRDTLRDAAAFSDLGRNGWFCGR